MPTSLTASGRTVTLSNRTAQRIGTCGIVLGPNASRVVSARTILSHPRHMTEMAALVQAGKLLVTFDSDILSSDEVSKLDTPLSGDLYVTRDVLTQPSAIDDNSIKLAWTAAAAATTYSGTDLDGVFGVAGAIDFARNLTIRAVTGGGEALTEKIFVITGTDINGNLLSESITVPARSATEDVTTQGVNAFKTVTSIYVPGDASSPAGDYYVGTGKLFGLSKPLTQGGLLAQYTDDAVPGVLGTVVLSPTALPFGTVSPNDDPHTHTYVFVYVSN